MAFLDNSGDIILDAVLTDIGRKRMADGMFKITRFGLGDDEINYGQYNPSHASGSAYYDLEIMQTPVLEAVTSINSNINYGLITLTDLELLYMPALAFNESTSENIKDANKVRFNNMFYLAANSETQTSLPTTVQSLLDSLTGTTGGGILWESGLDTAEKAATDSNRSTLIVNKDLLDQEFSVSAHNRFIAGVAGFLSSGTDGIGAASVSTSDDNVLNIDASYNSSYSTPSNSSRELEGFNQFQVHGIQNLIVDNDGGDADIYSALKGPRGTMAGLRLKITEELTSIMTGTRSRLYIDYGTIDATSNSLFSDGDSSTKYDYIDTTVYVQGRSSGASLQIPIRIIRQSS